MITKERVAFAIIVVLLFINPGDRVWADDKAGDRKTLRGIQAVVVKVHSVEPEWQAELEKVALSESILQSSIEGQLEKAGIQVISEEAASRSEFEGILNMRLKFSDPEPAKKKFLTFDKKEEIIEKIDVKKRYIYAIRLNLRQLVALQRDPSFKTFSITWQAESVGMRRLALMPEDVKSVVDLFIEAYASENPDAIKK
jgi:hypothetical protein